MMIQKNDLVWVKADLLRTREANRTGYEQALPSDGTISLYPRRVGPWLGGPTLSGEGEYDDSDFVRLEGIVSVVVDLYLESHKVGAVPSRVDIKQLDLAGHTTTTGGCVPVDCLEIINDTAPPQWRAAYVVWKGRQLAEVASFEKTSSRHWKVIELIATKYKIEPATVQAILDDLDDLDDLSTQPAARFR